MKEIGNMNQIKTNEVKSKRLEAKGLDCSIIYRYNLRDAEGLLSKEIKNDES